MPRFAMQNKGEGKQNRKEKKTFDHPSTINPIKSSNDRSLPAYTMSYDAMPYNAMSYNAMPCNPKKKETV